MHTSNHAAGGSHHHFHCTDFQPFPFSITSYEQEVPPSSSLLNGHNGNNAPAREEKGQECNVMDAKSGTIKCAGITNDSFLTDCICTTVLFHLYVAK